MLPVGGRAFAIHSFFHSQPEESHYFRAMYKTLKPLIFKLQPEKAHEWTMALLTFACAIPGMGALLRSFYAVRSKELEVEVAGLTFPNPVGLAAGFDKDARWLKQMRVLGFGFVEIGTVTPLPQDGNPKPRLFRLPVDKGIINRMGFNNSGMVAAAARLRRRPPGLIVGGNIGKNKITPNDQAESDYIQCFNALYDYVDYFVVNVSSPNTPGLRELQEKEPLQRLLEILMAERSKRSSARPIFLKIAPDLTDEQLDDIVELVQAAGIDDHFEGRVEHVCRGSGANGSGRIERCPGARPINRGDSVPARAIEGGVPHHWSRGNLRSQGRARKTRRWGVLGASVFRPDSRRPRIGQAHQQGFGGSLNRVSPKLLQSWEPGRWLEFLSRCFPNGSRRSWRRAQKTTSNLPGGPDPITRLSPPW